MSEDIKVLQGGNHGNIHRQTHRRSFAIVRDHLLCLPVSFPVPSACPDSVPGTPDPHGDAPRLGSGNPYPLKPSEVSQNWHLNHQSTNAPKED
jgi:hypothetical protein